jgi:hypothetical protein
VFDNIDYQKESDCILGGKVNVGGRLLVCIIVLDRKSCIQGVVDSALKQGVEEREKKGLNRFRLVLAGSRPDELRSSAECAFKLHDRRYASIIK